MNIINKFVAKIVGSRNDRLIKTYQTIVDKVNSFAEDLTTLSDEDLRAKLKNLKMLYLKGRV